MRSDNQRVCRSERCRNRNHPGARFCGRCGSAMAGIRHRRRGALAVVVIAGLFAALLAPFAGALAVAPPADPPSVATAGVWTPPEDAPMVIESAGTEAYWASEETVAAAPIEMQAAAMEMQALPVEYPDVIVAQVNAPLRAMPTAADAPELADLSARMARAADRDVAAILWQVDQMRDEVRRRAFAPYEAAAARWNQD